MTTTIDERIALKKAQIEKLNKRYAKHILICENCKKLMTKKIAQLVRLDTKKSRQEVQTCQQ